MPGLRASQSWWHVMMLLLWGWPQLRKPSLSFPCGKQSTCVCSSMGLSSFHSWSVEIAAFIFCTHAPKPSLGQQHCHEAPVIACTVVCGKPCWSIAQQALELTLDLSAPLTLHLACGLETESQQHLSLCLTGPEVWSELSRGVWATAA